jgi:hypothetical protein
MPSHMHAERHPAVTICQPSQGRIVIEPMPTPEKAMLSASPRLRTNQFVK